jgi:hypothetical protein
MIEPINSAVDARNRQAVGYRRPSEHQNGYTQSPRRRNLAVGSGAAAVLSDDGIDGVRSEQLAVVRLGERTPRKNVMRIGNRKRRIDRIDTADEVMMLRSRAERIQLLPPDCQKDASWIRAQRTNRSLRIINVEPRIAGDSGPWGAAYSKNVNSGLLRSFHRIPGNDPRIRMGRIDQQIDPVSADVVSESVRAAKAPASYRNGLSDRRRSSPRERHGREKIATGKSERELACLRRTTKNQKVRAHVEP